MSQKTGWLVVNSFINSQKFNDIYSLLEESAASRGINLKLMHTDEISLPVGADSPMENVDFIIWWDKDHELARIYEEMNIPVFNHPSAIEKCDDKSKTYLELSAVKELKIPKSVFSPLTYDIYGYSDFSFLRFNEERLGYPMVIKEFHGSFGLNVHLANNSREAESIIASISPRRFIMQEFIASSRGRDVRMNIVGGNFVCAMLRENKNDFRSNISNGGKMQAYEPPFEWICAAVTAVTKLGLDFAGVDVMFGEDGEPIICEVNANPHFRSTLEATGIDLSEHIIDYIASNVYGHN